MDERMLDVMDDQIVAIVKSACKSARLRAFTSASPVSSTHLGRKRGQWIAISTALNKAFLPMSAATNLAFSPRL